MGPIAVARGRSVYYSGAHKTVHLLLVTDSTTSSLTMCIPQYKAKRSFLPDAPEFDLVCSDNQHTRFWWRDLREREHVDHLGIIGRTILKCMFRKWEGVLWTGLIWLR
jgi:hypothetical protein